MTGLPRSGPSDAIDTVVIASAAASIALTALAAAIATIQVAATTSREHVVGAIKATDTPTGIVVGTTAAMQPHPTPDLPFFTAMGATGSLAAVAAVGAPADTVVGAIAGHPPASLLFLAASTSTPTGLVGGAASPLDATAAFRTPAGTATGATTP
jgi:hypothetical protein